MPRILQPKPTEPIRLIETKTGPRYRVVLTTSPKGAPRKQTTRTFDTLPEARKYVTATKVALDRGEFSAPNRTTFAELAAAWLKSRRDIRPVSVMGYRSVLRQVIERLGARRAQSITRRDVEAVIEQLVVSGLSQRTIVYTLGTIRQVLQFGVSDGVLTSNVAKDVRAPRRKKGDKKQINPWEPADVEKFLRHVDETQSLLYRVAFRLTACGLRRSEVLGLAWQNVDFERGEVKIKASRVLVEKGRTERDDPKSEASDRTVPVDVIRPGTTAMLRALKKQQAEDRLKVGAAYGRTSQHAGANLVAVDSLGLPVHPDAYAARFRSLSRAAGLREVGIHSVRHSLALTMHRAGVAPADAASLLGHTVGTHLSFYIPKTERGAASAASVLGSVLAAAGAG